MQSTLLPAGVCDEIEKLIRKVLQGGGHKERTCNLVKWETITKPKQCGGLALRKMREMNLAFMAKLGWRMFTDKCLMGSSSKREIQWGSLILASSMLKSGVSFLWRGINRAVPILKNGVKSYGA